MHPKPSNAVIPLDSSRSITVTAQDARAMQLALRDHLVAQGDHDSLFLAEELMTVVPVVESDGVVIGRWLLKVLDGQLVLVRMPPRGPVMYFFEARLAHTEHGWRVVRFDLRRSGR